jgi:hypothetical protein
MIRVVVKKYSQLLSVAHNMYPYGQEDAVMPQYTQDLSVHSLLLKPSCAGIALRRRSKVKYFSQRVLTQKSGTGTY